MAARDRMLALAVTALAALLVLPGLGSQSLWQDEAQTAVIARTILDHGIPLGSDGRNHFSQELGKEYADNQVWRWHTWLSFYTTAASLWLFGETTAAARLPFALFGILCSGLCYVTARALWRDRAAAVAAGLLCATSVPFLIFSRQCRYYTLVALLSLAALRVYRSLDADARAPTWLLFGAAILLFHTHYVYCATLLASLLLHTALFDRARLFTVVRVSAGVAALNLPWIVWFSGVRPGGVGYFETVLDGAKLLRFSADYLVLLGQFLPPWLLAVPALLVLLRWRRREPLFALDAPIVWGVTLLVVYCAVSILLLSALSPLHFYRYLAPLAPAIYLLGGLPLGALFRRSVWLGAAAALALLAGGNLGAHVDELRADLDGPIGGLVEFLRENAAPEDVVAISYGDMPLKFYTPLRVIGGLTGQSLSGVSQARWIVIRHATNTQADGRVKRLLRATIRSEPDRYLRHELDAPDLPFENREDPRIHRFYAAPAAVPRVVVFERRG